MFDLESGVGLVTAFSSEEEINLIPSSAIPSHIGLNPLARYASILCVNASIPVAAVRDEGIPIVSCGSSIVNVELVWDPPWDREMINEAARLQLGML